jgi:hypothetical protein
MVPTIGLLPAVTMELHTALVGDHLPALAPARVVDRGLELLRFRLLQATLAIVRHGGIAGMKRAKLRQNPCMVPTIGLLPAVTMELHTALVGDHLPANTRPCMGANTLRTIRP